MFRLYAPPPARLNRNVRPQVDTRARIREAFKGVAKPTADQDIAPHECGECRKIVEDFKPYTFDRLPDRVVADHKGSLPLLGPAALHHYLPAYMLYALDHPESDVMMYTVFQLTPSKRSVEDTKTYFDQRFGVFSEAQRKAIGAFLKDVRDYQLYDSHEQEFERAAELWPLEA